MSNVRDPIQTGKTWGYPSLSPVDGWQVDSTSRQVVLRLSAERSSDFSIAARKHGFLLEPEQARQIIRDLSAAVLASDVKRSAEVADGQKQSRHD
jgi:hypothetical protein